MEKQWDGSYRPSVHFAEVSKQVAQLLEANLSYFNGCRTQSSYMYVSDSEPRYVMKFRSCALCEKEELSV
jgi:hypothetical protein